MAVNLIDPVTSSGTQATYTSQPNGSLTKEDFLTLLVAQLQYQDPMNPLEGTEFTAQLAQFSSLDQLFDINDNLSQLVAQRSSLANLEALGFVGKQVRVLGDKMSLGAEGGALARYSLEETAALKISIFDSAGKLVRVMEPGFVEAGEHDLAWDGLSGSGSRCPEGTYRFAIEATGLEGDDVAVTPYTLGTVSGVKLGGTEPYLVIGGAGGTEVALSSLSEVLN